VIRMEMSYMARKEYLQQLQKRYKTSDKKGKTNILNEYISLTKHNRKYVINQLNRIDLLEDKTVLKRNKQSRYEKIKPYLKQLWKWFDCICGQLLVPIIRQELDRLIEAKELMITNEERDLLITVSSSTVDRLLSKEKKTKDRKIYSTTKPKGKLKKGVPVKLSQWDENRFGYTEIDTVAHCGSSTSGEFISSISLTDLASAWWEGEAIMGKGQRNTLQGIQNIQSRLPFDLLGLDSDNGSEFMNYHLSGYCEKNNIEFTRIRPNRKNDNAHIEQKNWTHVRKVIGYYRHDSLEELEMINSLYQNELRIYKNFYQPTMKLDSKWRVDGHLKRKYGIPKTPYQRIIESDQINQQTKDRLTQVYQNSNPVLLKRIIDQKIQRLHNLRSSQSVISKSIKKEVCMVSF
jgi:hypothetical protein